MSILSSVLNKISPYLDIVGSHLHFDLYIVDNQLLRIYGTGMYSRMLGIVLPSNTSNGWVIKNKQRLLMFDPTKNLICEDCPMRISDNCGKEYSIHNPIFHEDNCIGVITISSDYTEESKKNMIQQQKELIHVSKVLTKFIETSIQDMFVNLHYEKLVTHMNGLFIIADADGKILQKSILAKSEFPDLTNIYHLIPKNNKTFGEPMNNQLSMTLSEDLHAERIKVALDHEFYHQIFIFNDSEDSGSEKWNPFSHRKILFEQLLGKSEGMVEVRRIITHVAQYDSNCLILGESGTGKEMVANMIHNLSERKNGPFVAINCAAIPSNLIESEIFGYESGAFTGANKGGKEGLFEAANHGTIFLDEIGDMPVHLQPKLLRAIETGKITRVGSINEIKLDVRFIAATNQNLPENLKNGTFRYDLYYRLSVFPIHIPSLRERAEDILLLTKYFMDKYNNKFHKNVQYLSPQTKKSLLLYDWPGNVRQLENVLEYAMSMTKGDTLELSNLPSEFHEILTDSSHQAVQCTSLEDFKKQQIQSLLQKYGSSMPAKEKIAKELGISLSTLYRLIRRING